MQIVSRQVIALEDSLLNTVLKEVRFVASGDAIVELLEGTGEIFGSELVQHKRYTFPTGSRVAIFTWHGCSIELVGETDGAYIAKQTPMVIYLNTHAALEMMRQHAEEYGNRGPRLMIVGPTDVGKSTYCRILLNYAGQISVPGTVGALFIERPADAAEGFEKRMPLVYSFGHLSPGENMPLYNMLVTKMAEVINARCANSKAANASGIIINTCGWIKGDGYACIVNAADAFEASHRNFHNHCCVLVVLIALSRLYKQSVCCFWRSIHPRLFKTYSKTQVTASTNLLFLAYSCTVDTCLEKNSHSLRCPAS
ncbi:unnamed protein product [Soboliphyme baturini]|uniref:Protein CLP1 homolog n=1 Tax=Soboliphyme baturini TaxID=241478 RepID=A0A183IWU8_9BILA|nr:unnamed protein product [Soboliphyme baturini]